MIGQFFKWILYSRIHSSRSEVIIRWNGLLCSIVFTMLFVVILFGGFDEDPFLTKIGFGGLVIYLWILTTNAWYFHKMRRTKAAQKARQRSRWMLKATPYCLVGLIASFLLFFIPLWLHETEHDHLFISIATIIMAPFLFTRIWTGVATTPFHIDDDNHQTGNGNREI